MDIFIANLFFASLLSILVITNPLSTIGIFLSLTKGMPPEEKREISLKTSIVACVVLLFFGFTGYWVFHLYSITFEAFKIAAGIALLAIGLKMLFPPEQAGSIGSKKSNIYIMPLAIPMTAGPGAITAAIVIAGNAPELAQMVSVAAAIIAACSINYLVLVFSDRINKLLGDEGVSALIRIMGLLVCSVAIQFMINGLKGAFPILAGA